MRRVMGSFSTAKERESAREEEFELLQHLPEGSSNCKLIMDRIVDRLERRVHKEGVGSGEPVITEGHESDTSHDERSDARRSR